MPRNCTTSDSLSLVGEYSKAVYIHCVLSIKVICLLNVFIPAIVDACDGEIYGLF